MFTYVKIRAIEKEKRSTIMAQENKKVYYPEKSVLSRKTPREIFREYFVKDDGKTTFVQDFNVQLHSMNKETNEPIYPGLVAISGAPLNHLIIQINDQVNALAKFMGYKINAKRLSETIEKVLLTNIEELESIVREGKTTSPESTEELKDFFIQTLLNGVSYIRENNIAL